MSVSDLVDFGYVFYGPLMFYFIVWLINQTQKMNVNIILFCAREGYFIKKLFNIVKRYIDIKRIPESIYFKTSRRMSTVSALFNKEDIYNSFNVHRYYGLFKNLLIGFKGWKSLGSMLLIVTFTESPPR